MHGKAEANQHDRMNQYSEKAILYLSKHFRKKITLEEIAKVAGVSPFHFHRKFVEENNCTPQNYLENIRMQHASHLIKIFPNWSLIDVAFESGYSSPGIFSRAFKKYYGITPSQHKLNSDLEPENIKLEKTKPIQIQYLTKKNIVVKKVSLIEKRLNQGYQKIINSTSSNQILFGVFMDVPFHVPLEKCRYFIGLETSLSEKDNTVLTIPAGYYTTMIIQGNFDHLKEKLVAKNNQIINKGYVIDSLIGYEKINANKKIPFDYRKTKREILMKIKRA